MQNKQELQLLDTRSELEYFRELAKFRLSVIKDYEKQMDDKGFSYTHHFG